MIKILLFVSIFSLFLVNSSFAYSENDISRLEFQKYGRCYEDESFGERLSRLETDYLGMTQSGDIDKRIYNLMAIGNSNAYETYENIQEEKQLPKKRGKLKKIWNNISSNLNDMGTMTGFIPPVTTYGNYNEYYPTTGFNHSHYYGMNNNGHWNSYNPYPNAYLNDTFHNNHIYNRGCIHHPHHHFNPINNRIIHRINRNLHHNRYYSPTSYPMIYPNYFPSIPTQGFTNYSTRSTVRIIRD